MAATTATAQTTDEPEDLGTSVVTASRVEESVISSTASVSVISSDDIFQRSIRSLPDALRETPGVLIQKTTHGHGSPYIRGFTGRQNLLLVDGIRMNNSTYRSGPVQYWNTLDSGAIRRLELVKGPQSALYGSDALGGALNVLSKDTGFRDEQGWFYGGSATYRFDTNSQSHVGRIEQRFGVGDKWGAILGVSGKDFGDIKDANLGRMTNTGYREENLDFKFQYALNATTELTFAHQYLNQDDVWRWHSTLFNRGWTHGNHVTQPGKLNFRIYDQERSLTYLRLNGESEHSLLENWQTTLSYQKSQDSESRDGRYSVADVETFGLSFQGSGALKDGEIIWGLDYYHDEVNSSANEPRRRPVADDSSYDTLGAFAHYKWSVNDRLKVTTGARASYFKAKWGKVFNRSTGLDESGEGDWSNLSFSIGANYALTDDTALFSNLSQGFRAPNLEDLTGSNVSNASDEVVGSANIDPEEVFTYELGVKHDDGNFRFTGSAFYTYLDNPIVYVDDNTVSPNFTRITNGESGYIFGAELEGKWDFTTDWALRGNLTWQDGKQKLLNEVGGVVTEDTIRRLAPFAGSVAVRWTHPSERFWIEGSVLAAVTQRNLANRDLADNERIPSNGTPGYMIGSIHAGWKVTEQLELNLGLENLTDEDYRVHGSGINETGFNTVLGLKYTW